MSTSPTELEHSSAVSYAGKDELGNWNWGRVPVGFPLGARSPALAQGNRRPRPHADPVRAIATRIVFALNGNRWIWERGGYESREQLRRKERTRAWAYLWFALAALAISVIVGVAGA